jgi:hypothetical protein
MKTVAFLLAAAALLSVAQTPAPSRGMQSQVFIEMREAAQATNNAKAAPATKISKAKPAAKSPSNAAKQLGNAFLGVNLWHMKLADSSAQVRVRGLKHRSDPAGTRDWTPERVDFTHSFGQGEHLRISMESARQGYLYVINRDVFADGSRSAPTLIFPTKRIKGGNNLVQPGVPIEIPDFNDNPPTFFVEDLLPNQTGIELLMIVTTRPLAGIAIPEDQVKLPEAQVAQWERDWGLQVQLTEDRSLIGRVYTLSERNAASDPAKPLGGNDAVPLALYDRPGSANEPMLAKGLIKVVAASR